MKNLLRRWVVNPAPFLVVLVVAAVFAANLWEPLGWVLGAAALVTFSQWIRLLWRRSKVATLIVGAALPLFAIWQTPSYERELSLLAYFVPGLLAIIMGFVPRAFGSSLLGPPASPEASSEPLKTPPPKLHGCVRGMGCLAIFGAVTLVYFVWTLNAPTMAANAFKEKVQIGMTLSDVVVTSFGTGRHLVFVNAAEGAPRLYVGESGVTVGAETGQTESAVRAILNSKGAELRVKSLSFMFLTSIPVRSSIVVRFGPDGKVVAFEGPYGRAD